MDGTENHLAAQDNQRPSSSSSATLSVTEAHPKEERAPYVSAETGEERELNAIRRAAGYPSEHPKGEEGLGEKEAARPATVPRQMECEDAVIAMIQRRRERGRAKYGQTMERQDLTIQEWLTHAQEEALDLAIYLEAIMRRFPSERACRLCGSLLHREGWCPTTWQRSDSATSVPGGIDKHPAALSSPKTSVSSAHPEDKEGEQERAWGILWAAIHHIQEAGEWIQLRKPGDALDELAKAQDKLREIASGLKEPPSAITHVLQNALEELDVLASICTCKRPTVSIPGGGVMAPGPHTDRCVLMVARKVKRLLSEHSNAAGAALIPQDPAAAPLPESNTEV